MVTMVTTVSNGNYDVYNDNYDVYDMELQKSNNLNTIV